MKANQKIPEGWSVKKLGEVTTLLTNGFVGSATPHYTEDETGVTYIQGFNVNINSFDLTGIKKVTLEFHKKNKKSCLQEGDLLTIQTGDIGVTARVPKYLAGSNCHALIISRFDTAICNSKFYLQYYNSSICQSRFKKIETGSTMKHLNVGDLESEYIPVPPLPEQEKIAGILGTWDEAIEKLSGLIEQKKLLKKGLMQKLLTGKTRLSGFTQPWREVKLGEICKLETANSKSSLIIENGKYCVIDMGAVSSEAALISTKKTNSNEDLLDVNDVVMPKDDIGGGNIIGKTAIIKQDNTYVLSDHVFKLKIHKANPTFISYLINSYQYNKYMRRMSCGSAILGLSKKDVEKCLLYIPDDISEQQAIADVLSTADDEINLLNQKLEALKEQKKGLMQQLLTGQIRVKVN